MPIYIQYLPCAQTRIEGDCVLASVERQEELTFFLLLLRVKCVKLTRRIIHKERMCDIDCHVDLYAAVWER